MSVFTLAERHASFIGVTFVLTTKFVVIATVQSAVIAVVGDRDNAHRLMCQIFPQPDYTSAVIFVGANNGA